MYGVTISNCCNACRKTETARGLAIYDNGAMNDILVKFMKIIVFCCTNSYRCHLQPDGDDKQTCLLVELSWSCYIPFSSCPSDPVAENFKMLQFKQGL